MTTNSPAGNVETTERTRDITNQLLTRMGAGDLPSLLEMLAHDVEWDVPGDTEHVPWLGRRTVEQVPGFFEAMAERTIRERFDVERIVVDGPAAVIIGYAGVRLQATNESIGGRFAIELIVNADGKITRFYMFEDSWKVASAVRPHLRRAPSEARASDRASI